MSRSISASRILLVSVAMSLVSVVACSGGDATCTGADCVSQLTGADASSTVDVGDASDPDVAHPTTQDAGKTAKCGDGVLDPGETCDDGNQTDTDACRNDCTSATCGDAVVQQDVEACDDGNKSDTDACLTTCVAAKCGDGVVHDGVEECDDKNDVDTDGCRNNCKTAVCGDGVVQAGVEECDGVTALCNDQCKRIVADVAFSGAAVDFTVPAGVSELRVEAWGAQGGGAKCCDGSVQDDGGLGGYSAGTFAVTAGDVLHIRVGGKGITEGAGGFNGGGTGGQWGAGGGGASDIRLGGDDLASRILVAGGGGGGNCGCPDHGVGGAAGGLDGNAGNSLGMGYTPGGGGTQMSGGAASGSGTPGVLGAGGGTGAYHVAGGGGGYYGGGGAYASGAGGGSSYYGTAKASVTTSNQRTGDGLVRISVP